MCIRDSLWQKRLEAQAISYQQIEKLLDRVKEESTRNKSFKRFNDYLEYFLLILRMVSDLRASGIKDYEDMLNTGSFGNLKDKGVSSLVDGELADFLNRLRSMSLDSALSLAGTDQDSNEYQEVMREYFSGIKTGFNPLFSQDVANQMIVVHSVFLEGCTTQQQLEEVTLLPRSTISEVLTQSVKKGLIKVTRKEGSRVKLYQPAFSFTDFMLGSFAQVETHISQVMPKLTEYIKRVKKVRNSLNQKKPFLNALSRLVEAYTFTRDFSRIMKVTMARSLKEKIDSGHVFI